MTVPRTLAPVLAGLAVAAAAPDPPAKPPPARPAPAAGAPARRTVVGIRGEAFTLNGEPTYKGRTWAGKKVEGLLLNSRTPPLNWAASFNASARPRVRSHCLACCR